MNSGPFLLCKDNIKILFTLQFLVLWIHYFSKKNHIRRILLQALQNFIFWLFPLRNHASGHLPHRNICSNRNRLFNRFLILHRLLLLNLQNRLHRLLLLLPGGLILFIYRGLLFLCKFLRYLIKNGLKVKKWGLLFIFLLGILYILYCFPLFLLPVLLQQS